MDTTLPIISDYRAILGPAHFAVSKNSFPKAFWQPNEAVVTDYYDQTINIANLVDPTGQYLLLTKAPADLPKLGFETVELRATVEHYHRWRPTKISTPIGYRVFKATQQQIQRGLNSSESSCACWAMGRRCLCVVRGGVCVLPNLDLRVAASFYDSELKLFPANDALIVEIVYRVFADIHIPILLLLIGLFDSWRGHQEGVTARRKRQTVFLLTTLLVGPGLITHTFLKDNSFDRPRPRQIEALMEPPPTHRPFTTRESVGATVPL